MARTAAVSGVGAEGEGLGHGRERRVRAGRSVTSAPPHHPFLASAMTQWHSRLVAGPFAEAAMHAKAPRRRRSRCLMRQLPGLAAADGDDADPAAANAPTAPAPHRPACSRRQDRALLAGRARGSGGGAPARDRRQGGGQSGQRARPAHARQQQRRADDDAQRMRLATSSSSATGWRRSSAQDGISYGYAGGYGWPTTPFRGLAPARSARRRHSASWIPIGTRGMSGHRGGHGKPSGSGSHGNR